MVSIAPPPPIVPPDPQFFDCAAGTKLVRMYDPSRYAATAAKFRFAGPFKRFDHQSEIDNKPVTQSERGIMYAGDSLPGCIVEIFGDSRVIDVGSWEVAALEATRSLKLLDLRGAGAMQAGTVAAVCKDSNHRYSQEWSRFFYETSFVYRKIDGIMFQNAHNEERAFAFYERCQVDFLVRKCWPFKVDGLRTPIQKAAADFGLIVSPY